MQLRLGAEQVGAQSKSCPRLVLPRVGALGCPSGDRLHCTAGPQPCLQPGTALQSHNRAGIRFIIHLFRDKGS